MDEYLIGSVSVDTEIALNQAGVLLTEEQGRIAAIAAIKAAFGHVRDNITPEMVEAGAHGYAYTPHLSGSGYERAASAVFVAMINAAIGGDDA